MRGNSSAKDKNITLFSAFELFLWLQEKEHNKEQERGWKSKTEDGV